MKTYRERWVILLLLLFGAGAWVLWQRDEVTITFVGIGPIPPPQYDTNYQGRYAIFSINNRAWGRIHYDGRSVQLKVQRQGQWQPQMELYSFSHRTLTEMDAGIEAGKAKLIYVQMDPKKRPSINEPFRIGLNVYKPPSPIVRFAPDWLLEHLSPREEKTFWSEVVTP